MSGHSSGSTLAAAITRTRQAVTTLGEWLPGLSDGVEVSFRPARRVAFWVAVALPFLLVALLARGLSNGTDTLAFLALIVVELVALVLGHSHRRE